jgi:two-component system chemotaxis response regulator CheB
MSDKLIVIGGSAGSFQIVTKILNALPKKYPFPVFLCLHRLKHVRTGFIEALTIKSNLTVVEPEDKTHIKPGYIYLAPANYHMYLDLGNIITLSTETAVNHSRPSIDLTFSSAAFNYKQKVVGIILSGANKDGADGLADIKREGGITIAQSLDESQVKTMPEAAMAATKLDYSLNSDEIISFLLKLE